MVVWIDRQVKRDFYRALGFAPTTNYASTLLPSNQRKYRVMKHLPHFEAQSTQAWSLIAQAHHIALLAHQKPDPDAFGACTALALMLEQHGKTTEIIYPGHGRDLVPYTVPHLQENTHTQIPDLIISCDAPVVNRLYFPPAFHTIPLIAIDHHQGFSIPADYSFVDVATTSTCELVYRLLLLWQQAITPTMANALLFGIICDTANFKVPGTTAQTFRVVADLIDHGANLHLLNEALVIHANPAILTLWGELFSNARYNTEKGVMWTSCTKRQLANHHLNEDALDGFIGAFSHVIAIDVKALFYEYNGETKVSLRSKKRNVQAIVKKFGGGGHLLAAGMTSTLPLEEVQQAVLQELLA